MAKRGWAQRPIKWIRTTIAEPFPVFYSHVSQRERRAGLSEGPHYAAGSEWFALYDEKTLNWKQSSAETLRKDGYTVTVDVVEKLTYCSGR
jgi:hypothetical protein